MYFLLSCLKKSCLIDKVLCSLQRINLEKRLIAENVLTIGWTIRHYLNNLAKEIAPSSFLDMTLATANSKSS